MVFEMAENLRPGETATWPIRLRNFGTSTWVVSGVRLDTVATADPGAACPVSVFGAARHPNLGHFSEAGVYVLGKDGDVLNDNTINPQWGFEGFPQFLADIDRNTRIVVRVAAGDYEDVLLRVGLFGGTGVEGCDSSQWNVTWTFTVS
jgi:hypothetical protein